MWNSRKSDKGFTLIELLIVVAIIGILAAIAIPNLLTAMQRARQKRTMSDMRNLCIAWEARATDVNSFSAAGSQASFVWPATDLVFSELEAILTPTYIRNLPEKDGWGTVYDFGADQPVGSVIDSSVYAVRSLGRNGQVDGALTPGAITNFSCDIVYSNGSFVTYPDGVVVN